MALPVVVTPVEPAPEQNAPGVTVAFVTTVVAAFAAVVFGAAAVVLAVVAALAVVVAGAAGAAMTGVAVVAGTLAASVVVGAVAGG